LGINEWDFNMYLVINNSGYHSFDALKSMVAAIRTVVALYPEDHREKIRYGVHELIINAVEHGVLKLGNKKKYHLKRKGPLPYQNHLEENLKTNLDGIIMVTYEEADSKIILTISDGGDGFDWKKRGGIEEGVDGTGLLIAKGSFDEIGYNKSGNVITAVINII
jgi:two-component system, cell cycle response regulator